MKLRDLCARVGIEVQDDCVVYGLSYDSRRCGVGDIFFSTNGDMDYIDEAIDRGAIAIVSSTPIHRRYITNVVVDDVRKMMAKMSSIYYQDAHKSLKLIAVTGTNGKTTITDQLYKIGTKMGHKCGIIGTLGAKWGNNRYDTGMTTPDSVTLHMLLSLMKNDGVEYVFMEASAHAIYLNKLYGLNFEVAVFTNLTQDHLDYFVDMNSYKLAKLPIFSKEYSNHIVANTDDEVGREIYFLREEDAISYALYNPADIFAVDINFSKSTTATLNLFDDIYHLNTRLTGIFNVYNILAILGVAHILGWDMDKCINDLIDISLPEGRFYMISNGEKKVIVDYAHTPDAMLNVLKSATILGKRKIVVFGCGGDRDKDKRCKMGEIAYNFADTLILTEDNTRSERLVDVIHDISKGIVGEYIVVPDREKAIKKAIDIASSEDVILVLGKGAERYIEKNGEKIPFSDIQCVHKLLGE
ncbi:MAG: UDP-N-acetylmuramoyl-L-alanyl-D-glutamate--2,6-diaminopimelate ligase [Clostridia bacterium]|nr:UDP-N-acetylmuramoyl-L-alanyl-D-glutamate--2,6-diaminopimelate ligase [Clostridia bacterium]